MKSFTLTCSSICLLLLTSAFICTPQQKSIATKTTAATGTEMETKTETTTATAVTSVFKIMEVTYLWELLKQGYQPNRERDATWLEVGFRAKYAKAKNYISLEILEAVFGVPVFIKGPHKDQMNFNSTTSFGYYNPEFITKVKLSVDEIFENPVFKAAAKKVYHENFRSMALTYLDAHRYLNDSPEYLKELKTKYLQEIAQPGGTTNGSLQETFRDYADHGEFADAAEQRAYETLNPNADWYEAVTAPAFWLRRSIDGTDGQIENLLGWIINNLEE